MKLSHIAEAALNQQMSSQRCHPHMAPIDTVGPDGPHPRVLKELNSVTILIHISAGLAANFIFQAFERRKKRC